MMRGATRRLLGIAFLPAFLAGCISLTVEPRALLQQDDGAVRVQTLACGTAESRHANRASAATRAGLDPSAIRILTWNIHKQEDAGWQQDLRAFSGDNDILLLQETVLEAPLQTVVADAGFRWVMASSFIYGDIDVGVLTASRVAPLASCTQRVVEPLLRIPKSAVISWFPLQGRAATVAVVNVHAINFSILLSAYRAQFDAIAQALEAHEGPIILAGDLNTWTAGRSAAVKSVAERLGLTEILFAEDRRRLFFGHELDHIYARGFELVNSSAMPVTSSDHNPVMATLRLAR